MAGKRPDLDERPPMERNDIPKERQGPAVEQPDMADKLPEVKAEQQPQPPKAEKEPKPPKDAQKTKEFKAAEKAFDLARRKERVVEKQQRKPASQQRAERIAARREARQGRNGPNPNLDRAERIAARREQRDARIAARHGFQPEPELPEVEVEVGVANVIDFGDDEKQKAKGPKLPAIRGIGGAAAGGGGEAGGGDITIALLRQIITKVNALEQLIIERTGFQP